MSTRKTSAQGDPCALSVGESLLSQQELSAPESIGTIEKSTGQLAGDAQGDAQLTIDAAQAHWHLDLLGRDERDVHIRAIPHKGKPGKPSTATSPWTWSDSGTEQPGLRRLPAAETSVAPKPRTSPFTLVR